jgi:hypothetical protein
MADECDQPSAASNTIRARCTSRAAAVRDRAVDSNTTRSSADNDSGARRIRSSNYITVISATIY